MYYNITKRISYFLIIIGIVLIILGLWQYLPKTMSSRTPDFVIMKLIANRITFLSSGLLLTVIGYTILKLVHEIKEETQLLKSELRRLSQLIKQIQKS